MAPIDFQDQLRNRCEGRIHYEAAIQDAFHGDDPIISTIPMYVLSDFLGMNVFVEMEKSIRPIYVTRYRIDDCDAHMTNYFPDPSRAVYRASISGDILIIECTMGMDDKDWFEVIDSFGLSAHAMSLQMSDYEQRNGKLSPIDESLRKEFILHTTLEHGIYSLGRFAIWKNILLDDVFKDIDRIRHFINLSKYDHMKES